MLYILRGLPGCKLQNKVEMTALASVGQILLRIEELQTFNMVSGIDLRHLALWAVYYLALVSPHTPVSSERLWRWSSPPYFSPSLILATAFLARTKNGQSNWPMAKSSRLTVRMSG